MLLLVISQFRNTGCLNSMSTGYSKFFLSKIDISEYWRTFSLGQIIFDNRNTLFAELLFALLTEWSDMSL